MAGGKRRYQTVRDERLSVGVTQPVNGGSQVLGVADGDRTHDNRNHNPGLYH